MITKRVFVSYIQRDLAIKPYEDQNKMTSHACRNLEFNLCSFSHPMAGHLF